MTASAMVHQECRARHRTFTVILRHVPHPESGARIIGKRKVEHRRAQRHVTTREALGQEPDQQCNRKPRENDQSETQQEPGA
jgi:hypothetical protein